MGCFGYICNKCGLSIRDGERAVFRHIRHGEVLGEAVGEADSYGRIIDDEVYRSWKNKGSSSFNINSHEEICASEFDFKDSIGRGYVIPNRNKNYKGKEVTLDDFLEIKNKEEDLVTLDDITYKSVEPEKKILFLTAIKEYNELPDWEEEFIPKSGVAAFHAKCYYSLKDTPEHQALRVKPSEQDPYQACGTPRKRFL